MDTSHESRERASDARLPRVVIVGGGFGGLYATLGLARAPVTVTVVDKHNYHLFRPMLYQVATGLLSSDEVAAPIRPIFSWSRQRLEFCPRTLKDSLRRPDATSSSSGSKSTRMRKSNELTNMA